MIAAIGMPLPRALASAHDVRLHAPVVDGEHPARTAEPALHFVGNEHDPVLVADTSQHGHERRRRHDVAAFALHGLDDDRGHRVGRRSRGEEEVQFALDEVAWTARGMGAIAEAVRIADVVDPRQERTHPTPVGRLARGERERTVGATVESADERDDVAATGGSTRELHRALDGLGTAVGEEDLVERRWRDRDERSGGVDHRRMHGSDRRVPEAVHLRVDGRDDRRVPVTEAGHADPTSEIEHVATVDGVQVSALGSLNHEVGIPVIRRRDQLGVALTPGGRIRGEHAGHEPDAAVADPEAAFWRTPTLPRARKPANMIAMPAAS